MTCYEAFQN